MSSRNNQSRQGSDSPRLYSTGSGETNVEIEELSEDDMGYDGDIEIVRPDGYEDAESETDVEREPTHQNSVSPEDQLALKLRKLHCDMDQKENDSPSGRERSKKRRSKEMQGETLMRSPRLDQSDIEITELVNDLEEGPPPKRRRARHLRQNATNRGFAHLHDPTNYESSNSVTGSAVNSPDSTAAEDPDAMSLG